MKQAIRLTEIDLQHLIKESVQRVLREMEDDGSSDKKIENSRIKQEGKTVDLGPDWGVWKIQGGYAYPPKDCFVWHFGSLPFPDNFYIKPDEVIIKYIKNDIISRYENAYRNRGNGISF